MFLEGEVQKSNEWRLEISSWPSWRYLRNRFQLLSTQGLVSHQRASIPNAWQNFCITKTTWFNFPLTFFQILFFFSFFRRFHSVYWNIPEATQRQGDQGWITWSNRATGRCNERECQNCIHICKSLSDAEGPQQWLSYVFSYPLACARGKLMQTSQSTHSSLTSSLP